MRRKDKLITDIKFLHEVIQKAQVCRIGMVDKLELYVVPLSFGFDGSHIFFHSAIGGRKVDILKENNRVCAEFEQDVALVMETEKPCNWSVQYISIICSGSAELLEDLTEKSFGLNQIIKHYGNLERNYPFSEKELSSVLVYRLNVEEMVGKVSGIELG